MENKKAIKYFFFLTMLVSLSTNLAHPITPTFIKELNLGNYMFGVSFAAMSTGSFLLSPLMGKYTSKIGEKKLMALGLALYGVGQFLFMNSKTPLQITLVRLFCGASISAYQVGALTYIVSLSDDSNRGKNLTLYTTIQTVFATFGYLLGGVLGDFNIRYSFILQVILLMLSGLLAYTTSKQREVLDNSKISFNDVNPFGFLKSDKGFMTVLLAIVLAVTFVASMASTAYDQTFNYYIKDIFNFKPSYNGYIKAITGIASFIVNMSIAIQIQKKFNLGKSLAVIFIICTLLLFTFINVNQMLVALVFAILYYATNSIYLPIVQNLSAKYCNEKTSGTVMGYSYAMKSLGMIIGALIAGFIYDINPKSPFIFACICFIISALAMLYYSKKSK